MAEIKREFHDPSSQTRRRCKIYISHNKKDCSYFARLLAAELQSMSYDVFLSENMIYSEIKAESMYSDTEDCRLVVFVLSELFFKTHSLMDELEAFVDSKVSLLPVFYKLSHSEFKDPRRRAVWREEWHGFMQEKDSALAKMAMWECAMEQLGSCDGINYNSDVGSLMDYTQAICEAVCERVPLQVYWSKKLSHIDTLNLIQICTVAHKWFDDPSALHRGAQVVGVHGVWGVGKTTLGKALCNFYSSEFGGRACYVKLHYPPEIEGSVHKLKRIKKVLTKLMGMSQDFLEKHVKDLDQAYEFLDQCFDETPRKVFLVVDNVEDSWESQEEAADLFLNRSPFHLGSKVLVLARSRHTLLQLFWPFDNLCRNIKSFELLTSSQLAKNMFLKALGSKDNQSVEKKTISHVSMIYKQLFQTYEFILKEHMHPLFFVSLGHFLKQNNSDFWHSSVERIQSEEHLKKPLTEDDFFQNGLFKMVFDVLQETYDSLEPMEQEIFLDSALYMPKKEVLWLQQLHDQYLGEMFSATFKCLRKLRAVAFLRIENRMIQVHKLCILYAKMVPTKGRTLYIEGEIKWRHLQDALKGSADVLERIAFENCIFKTDGPFHHFIIDLSACDQVRVLRMCGIYSQGVVQVQLGSIKLRSLDLCSNHAPILISGDLSYLKCLAGVAETFSSHTISLAWISPVQSGDSFESLKVLKLSKGPASDSLRSKGLKQHCVGSRLEVLWLNGFSFHGKDATLQLGFWSKLKELTVFNIACGLRAVEGLEQLHNLRMLHLLYVRGLQWLPALVSLKKLKNIHVIGCKDLRELILPGSKLLSHCCIWKCKSLNAVLIGNVEEVEYSFENDTEEDIDEITRFPYDWKSDPCWECSDEFICSGGDLDDSFQDRYKEYMNRKQEKGLIYSSDEKKFFVYGCTNLQTVEGLSKLTSIKEFILREQQFRIARLEVVRPEFLDFGKLDCDKEGQPFRFSYLKFVNAARLTHLTCLSVQDVRVKGFVQELLQQLEVATTLKTLLVRCDVSGKCECYKYTPCFSFLSKDLTELTYSCGCAVDLASISQCTGLYKISLVNCIRVTKWPDFSQLSLLSSLNMGSLVLPDRLNEGQFQNSEDVEALSLPKTRSQKSTDKAVVLSLPKSKSTDKGKGTEGFWTSSIGNIYSEKNYYPRRRRFEDEYNFRTFQKIEDMGALTLHKDQLQKSGVGIVPWERVKAQTRQKTEYMGRLSSPDGWTKSLEVSHSSRPINLDDMRAILYPASWIKILSEDSEDTGAITLLNCLCKEVFQECALWCEPPVSPFGYKKCLGLGVLTFPETKEKGSHHHGDSVSECYSMTWKWLGKYPMPWQEVVKGSQPGLDDVLRIAPCKIDDSLTDSTSHKMMLGGFFF